ncbi:histone deacetylase complex subunit SAP130 isoform X2 [Orussus abietinus]|uniref:histone deacetylase complex subunit SAP130 isoform X2 n=1 Tax=Orussus abietinus TaxID=222816 RepID=UPI000626DB4C|nr:histone deacetylase complex subunit SAP130 isoform X2 [Orussus abietinus]
MDNTGEKYVPEINVQSVMESSTTIQGIQSMPAVHNVSQAVTKTIQSAQTIIGQIGTPAGLVGKSVSLELNPKLSLMKPLIPSGMTTSVETSKITTTLCSVGSAVKILSPGVLNTLERQGQVQVSQQSQQNQQVSIPSTYHVPRGPAAVANISAPRSTVATPIVKASGGQSISASRPNTTVSNPQWQQSKTASVVYAQPQRHLVSPVSRIATKTPSTVYSGQQPRLVNATQGRSIQGTMVTGISGAPSRLIAPVLQPNTSATRLPVVQSKIPTCQTMTVTQTNISQTGRPAVQTLQSNQASRPLNATSTASRMTVPTVMAATNRMAAAPSVSVQPTTGRQLTLNSTNVPATGSVNRIVIPPQQIPQGQQQQQQSTPRVVQAVTTLSNLGTISRVIATTATVSHAARVTQPTPSSVARITGMSLHPMPLVPTRTAAPPVKTTHASSLTQPAQLKSPTPIQQSSFRVTTSSNSNAITSNSNIIQQVQGPCLHPPQTTTYYSFETSSSSQPVRLLVDSNYEEAHNKPNASPRPSILRKRDHDSSPAKGAVKNLFPVLASLSTAAPTSTPPLSPRGDQDGGGCHSSGSTTVSATSSPGLDDEPNQSRIGSNSIVEMSPRKKPRKQQLIGVELMEPRCTEEEMQFITEEKIKLEIKEEPMDKLTSDKKQNSNVQSVRPSSVAVRTRPALSLLGTSWKNKWGGRLHHYRRPSDVRPREERRPTVAELAQQKHVLQKLNGWKVYHLTTQMEDLAELEKQVHEKLKATLSMLESQQTAKGRIDDGLEQANELIKGNMQRSSLICEGMNEARAQLVAIFQHKGHVTEILQRCGNKRAQKKRDK